MSSIKRAGTATTLDLSRFSVLLVEDYEFVQQLLSGMLKAFGVGNIAVCSGGNDAKGLLQVMAASKTSDIKMVDIVLTDWMMPGGDGSQLVKWIRNHKDDKVRFLPIVMISAFTNKNIVLEARDIGANEAVVKPVSGEILANRILNVINHPRAFIKAPNFFGPDRRRKTQRFPGEEKRKTEAEQIKVNHEKIR